MGIGVGKPVPLVAQTFFDGGMGVALINTLNTGSEDPASSWALLSINCDLGKTSLGIGISSVKLER